MNFDLLIGFEDRKAEMNFDKLKAVSQLNICLLNYTNGKSDETDYIIKSLNHLAKNPPSCNVGHYHAFPLVTASIALAKEISCFSPVESMSPPSPTSVSRPFSSFSMTFLADTRSIALQRSSSVASSFPYLRLSLMDPENR